MSNYHPAATLAKVSNTLVAAQEQEGRTASPYYEAVGSPIYAMIATRPDISAAISQETRVSHGDLPNKQQSHYLLQRPNMFAATTATQELLFLKTFLTEIGYPINKTTTLYSDSQSAIANTKNIQLRHASNKHMDIKLHFPKDQVKLGNVNLKYINTLDQVADILIKGLPKPAFCKLANLLGLLPLRVEEGC
ncbi:hypothetical protein BASA61_001703 [Batrachochytrium salamandrivorans]|nr:hypothetical protein BASA61_001703 [Batrachochytrium salamandrivorans]